MRRHWMTLLVALVIATPATAEELLVDRLREVKQSDPIEIPRGRTMEQVKERRGEPDTVKGPVGEPPITQWVYEDFTVYFEKDRVIHAVVQR